MERPIVSGLQWRVEEACLNAWPALREVLLDGWLLRFSEGLTRRANSANALAPVGSPALTKCQCLYRRLGLPTIFRVLSFADPAIDQQLAEAGYTSEGESCVLYGKIDELEAVPDAEVRLVSRSACCTKLCRPYNKPLPCDRSTHSIACWIPTITVRDCTGTF